MTFEDFKAEFDSKLAAMTDEQIVAVMRSVGCDCEAAAHAPAAEQPNDGVMFDGWPVDECSGDRCLDLPAENSCELALAA